MIALAPLENTFKIKELFLRNEIEYNGNSGCVVAMCGAENIGYCLYDLESKKMIIRFITPDNDISLADGILRSTLHIAAQRGIIDTYYSETAPEKLFRVLGFIKNEQEKSLKTEKLFESCCCGDKK